MKKILFLCTGNSCRSQMAEGWTRHIYGDTVEVYSAGTAPHGVDPRAVTVMAEAGVDISKQSSNHVDEYLDIPFDLIVTVCDSARESCPFFPGRRELMETEQIHQSGCERSDHPGVGVEPGGITPPGGGGIPSPASRNGSLGNFARPPITVHHSFDDPPFLARNAMDEKEVLEHYRRVRDEIREFVAALIV